MNRTLNKIVTSNILALTLLSPVKFSNAQDTSCEETIGEFLIQKIIMNNHNQSHKYKVFSTRPTPVT